MLENSLGRFCESIYEYLTNEHKPRKGLLVKKHSEHLQKLGDLSFPNTVQSWHNVLDSSQFPADSTDNFMQAVMKTSEDLVLESKKWELPVKSVKEVKDRIHLFLLRPTAIYVGLVEGLKNNDLISQKIQQQVSSVHIDSLCEDDKDITYLRLRCLTQTIKNLCAINDRCTEDASVASQVFVTSKSSSKCKDSLTVLCGTVSNAATGMKECLITSDEFIKLRQNEITLIAQHKYGVRVATDSKWRDFIAHLGESAVIFELLQTRPSGAVKINFDHSASGSSKDTCNSVIKSHKPPCKKRRPYGNDTSPTDQSASFILYNCARLETLMRTFNEKVENGTYPPLPSIDSVDFTLLTHEDEWILVFNFILGLPLVLENCVEIKEKVCDFRPHHICSFLSSMVRVFSQYYRKVRVLTEPRTHLLPVMFSRIHMLKVLNETLKTCLRILNIKSVSQM